jgi:acetolactate synthase-1/2/3 large subunit
MEVTGATGLANILKEEGIDWVATFPVCNVNNTLAKEGIKLIMMRDERYTVALADAYSRVTGGKKIGVCTVMGGSNPAGLQFAFPALAQAYEDSSPVLCIGDGLSPAEVSQANWDLQSGLNSVTKWTGHVVQPDRVPEFMRRAFTTLRNGHPGPVVLTFPRGLGEYDSGQHPYASVKSWRYAPTGEDIESAVEALLGAEKPLILAGHGVFFADAMDELLSFAEAMQIPVVTTLNGKSCFPENHPLSAGVRGEPAKQLMTDCDVLFGVGTSFAKGHFRHSIPNDKDKTVIQSTIDEQDVNRTFKIDIALIGDAKLTLQAMIDCVKSQERGTGGKRQAWLDTLDSLKKDFKAKYQALMESDEKPINPYRVYGDLMKVIDRENSFISPDSGNTRDQTSTAIETITPHGFLGWGNISTLGFSLAAAMAAKLAYPERQCVNITGDAGFNYMVGNFEPLVHYGIGTTTIHINNDGFSGYGPGFWGEGHDPYTSEVTDHKVTHTAEAVKAMGLYAERIEEPEEIIPAMERAFKENEKNTPALLEFICSRYPVTGAWA